MRTIHSPRTTEDNIHLANFRLYLQSLNLAEGIVEEIVQSFEVRRYSKNEAFSVMGSLDDKLGFVADGLFYMAIDREDGSFFTKDFLGNNQFLLASFNPAKPSLVNIRAITDSVVLDAKYSRIQALFLQHEDFAALCRRGMEKKLEFLYGKLETMAMLEAKDRYLLFQKDYGLLEAEIPQHLIASYLGITPTQLSRIRKKLSKSVNSQHM